MWLFIGKVNEGVEKQAVVQYIQSKCSITNSEELIVNELVTKGKSLAFKVGIDKRYYDQLTTGDFWPQGILVRRYNFWSDRRPNTSDNLQSEVSGGFLDSNHITQIKV